MYTSICLVGLMFASGPVPNSPTWMTSYSAGLDAGQKSKKPVAVFVGSGPKGQAGLLADGQFSPETLKILADKYVCIYLDRSDRGHQQLISELAITKAGLVISDRTGSYQAFHHDGTVSQVDLARQLQHFADPDLNVSTTVSNTYRRTSYYGAASSSPRAVTVSC